MKKAFLFFVIAFCGLMLHAQTVKWHYNLKDVSFGQTTARDVDGDGLPELIFSTYWNDSNVYCLNGEDGSLKWKHLQKGFGGGCNDAGPLIFDPFRNGDLKVVIPGSCMDTTFCVDADSGYVQWKTVTGGGDSPPSCADFDGDGYDDVIHGTFYGNVKCLDGRTGAIKWNQLVDTNAAIESEPVITRTGTEYDFTVATWDFTYDSNRIACYRASDHSLKWQYFVHNLVYHGPAAGDLFHDGEQEVIIGDYDGYLYCLRTSDGELIWKDSTSHLLSGHYIGSPVSLADLDNDGYLDVVYMDGYMVRAVNRNDSTLWTFAIPGIDYTNFRGAAIADVNNDGIKDVTFCSNYGIVYSLNGLTGAVIRTFDFYNYAYTTLGDTSSIFEVDNAPVIGDFDGDGLIDMFLIGGKGRSDSTSWNDYGYAVCLSWGDSVNGGLWPMFRHDAHRTGCLCDTNGIPATRIPAVADNHVMLRVFPDPSPGVLNVSFFCPAEQATAIRMFDMLGREVWSTAGFNSIAGQNTFHFAGDQTALLTNGLYIVTVESNGVSSSARFEIRK